MKPRRSEQTTKNANVSGRIRNIRKDKREQLIGTEENITLIPEPSHAVMRIAIIISVVLHLGLLMIKFSDPEKINDFFRSANLEVVIINAVTDEQPTDARLIAQANYAGGGDSNNPNDYATTPYDYAEFSLTGDSFEETQRQLNQARDESMRLLAQVQESYAQLPPIDPSWGENDPRRIAEEERRLELSNKIAAIEQQIREENARPRRMYIGPTARGDAQALYYDTIRRKIELRGTESFPQHAGLPLYGSLLMELVVNPQGNLINARVLQSSGNPVLDRQAQAIAASSGPFQAAPAELLKIEQNVEFVFIMRFNFLNEGRLSAELMERQSIR